MLGSYVMVPPATFSAQLGSVLTISSADVVLFVFAIGVAVAGALLTHRAVSRKRAQNALRVVTRASRTPTRSAA